MKRSPNRLANWLVAFIAVMVAAVAIASTPTSVFVYDNAGNMTSVTDTSVDSKNCGGVGVACSSANTAPGCVSGICSGACYAGWADCNNDKLSDGCESNILSDVNHCGDCIACSTTHITPSCVGGSCNSGVCAAGYANCTGNKKADGCESNILSDVNHCGNCIACSTNHITPSCVGGSCESGVCGAGWADCNNDKKGNGCETDITSDINHCGDCIACSTTHITSSCVGGSCSAGVCAAGYANCTGNKKADGCESNILSDVNHCGDCIACSTTHITPSCVGGSCETGVCAAGWADCNNDKKGNGCETSTTADVNHCGGCAACSTNHVTPACVGGSCNAGVCAAGWANCTGNKQAVGCETDITTLANCGACGNACAGAQRCISGVCTTVCPAGTSDKCGDGRCLGPRASCL